MTIQITSLLIPKNNRFLCKDYFFREWTDLTWFGRIKIDTDSSIAYISELTSARAFRHLTPHMQEFYNKNGYSGVTDVSRWFWMQVLKIILEDLAKNHPLIRIVVVKTLEKNRAILARRIFEHFSWDSLYIKRITGWWEDSVATFFL